MSIINNLFHRLNLADDSTSLDVLQDNASSHSSLSFLSESQENSLKQPMIRLLSQILDPPEQSHSPPSGLTISQLSTTGLSGTMAQLLSQLPAFSNSGGSSGGGSPDSGGGITSQPAPAPIVLGLPITATFQENSVNILADSLSGGASVTVMDANSTRFYSLRVGYKNGSLVEDRLSVRNQGNGAGQIGVNGSTVNYGGVTIGTISALYNGLVGGALLILFNENATTAAVEALLENITYQNNSNSPTESRIITVDLDDGDGSPLNTVEIEVIVTPEDDHFITSALDNISAGGGDDVITGDADDLQAGDTIDGGADLDSIDLLTPGSGTIGADVSNVERVRLADSGSYTLTVTTPAMAEFTIDGSALTGTNALNVDASAYAGNLTILGGQGNDAVTIGSGDYDITLNEGNDSVISSNANFDNTITIVGGAGTDTIKFTDSAAISAADLANITGIDVIDVSAAGATSIVLSDAFVDASDNDSVEIANGGSMIASLNTSAVDSARSVVIGGIATVSLAIGVNNRVFRKDGVGGATIISDGTDTIIGGTGNDEFRASEARFAAADVFIGATGTDFIRFTNAATITAAELANKTGIERIRFDVTGNSAVMSDAFVDAADADIVTLNGAAAGLTLSLDTSNVNSTRDVMIGSNMVVTLVDGVNNRVVGQAGVDNSIAGGTGNDTIQFSSAAFDTNDSVDGGTGVDIIHLTSLAGGATESFGANINAIEQVTLQDGSSYTLTISGIGTPDSWTPSGKNAGAWFHINGSALTGTNILNVDGSGENDKLYLLGGAGADTLIGGTAADYISGNDGDDYLQAVNGNADSFDGGAGNDIILGSSGVDTAIYDVNDTISVWGGLNSDHLAYITGTVTFDGGVFREWERFTPVAAGANITILDSYRTAGAGLSSTLALTGSGSTSPITWDSSALTTIGVSLIGGSAADSLTATNQADTISAGNGNDTIAAGGGNDSIDGGAHNDVIQFASANFDANDTVAGGADTDTIQFTTAASVVDAAFVNKTGIERVILGDFNGNTISVGATAQAAGILTVDGSAATGTNTVSIHGSTYSVGLSLISGAGNDTLVGGTGDDTIIAGDGDDSLVGTFSGSDSMSGGNGDDIFRFDATLGASDTLDGGAGADTLYINGASGTAFSDTRFANKTGIEQIVSADVANRILTLGANAQAMGLITVDGSVLTGTNSLSVDASAFTTALSILSGTGADTLIGGTAADTFASSSGNDSLTGNNGNDVFQFASANFDASDTVTGGADSDTLQFTTAASQADAAFANKTSIERILLGDFTGQTLTLAATAQATGITTVDGSAVTGANTINVNANGYTTGISLVGGTGNDTLRSGTGNDTIIAGDGNDFITAGAGTDSISAGDGDDVQQMVPGNMTAADTIDGGAGNDTFQFISAATWVDAIFANKSNVERIELDDFTGQTFTLAALAQAAGIATVDGSALTGANTVSVDASAFTSAVSLVGGTGNDTLRSGSGNDTLDGGDGINIYYVSSGDDSIIGGAGNDQIHFNTLADLTNADTLLAGAGYDWVFIDTGAVTLNLDNYNNLSQIEALRFLSSAAHSVTVTDTFFTNNARTGIDIYGDTASNIGITVNGSAISAANILGIVATNGDNQLLGGAGGDWLYIYGSLDNSDTISGGAGSDVVVLRNSAMSINTTTLTNMTGIEAFTLESNLAHSLTLTNSLYASAGFVGNTVTVTTNNTTVGINVNAGGVSTAGKTVSITGGGGNDSIVGTHNNDTIYGGAGNDVINSWVGSDLVYGEDGNDSINAYSSTSADTVYGGNGNDTIWGGGGYAKTFYGEDGDDVISCDTIAVSWDLMDGGNGNDSITGGGGVDSLTGGADNDVFYYLATADSGIGVGNRDIITDFVSGTDDIDLSAMAGMVFRAGGNGVADFSGAAQVAWQQSGGNTIVYVDTDGDDTADFEIELTGLIALVAGDFVL